MEHWWSKYDWSDEPMLMRKDGIARNAEERALMIADMFGDTPADVERYYDEILADIMRDEGTLN